MAILGVNVGDSSYVVPNGKQVTNPPFDPRIRSRPMTQASARGKGLFRGYIVQEQPASAGKGRYRLNFLYNPSTVSVSHSVDINNPLLPPVARQDDPSASPMQQPQGSVSFNLLFDRTFETWDSDALNKPEGKKGVYADVEALYNVIGITAKAAGADGYTAIGVMQWIPVYAFFGSTARSGAALAYHGIIQSVDITYTHWTQDMIPSRCSVGINMGIIPKVLSEAAGTAGSSTDQLAQDLESTTKKKAPTTKATPPRPKTATDLLIGGLG